MPSFRRLTDTQLAQQLERLLEATIPATPAELTAWMAALGLEETDRGSASIRYASELLGDNAAIARVNHDHQRIEEVWFYFAHIADEGDEAQLAVMKAALADTQAVLKQRLGKPHPEYPRGKTKGEIYGEEDRYTWHRLPNGLDIIVPIGVDPTRPVKAPKRSRWTLPNGQVLELRPTKLTFVVCLLPPTPATNEDGLAIMWDGTDNAPAPAPEALSPSPTQTELLTALAAGAWPADKAQLQDLLKRMGFALQLDMFNRESWVKGERRLMRRAVIRTYPETGKVELVTTVVADDKLAKYRKSLPFKAMEQAFDNALAHSRTVLGAPAHESATREPGTIDAASMLRVAQWRRAPVTISLRLRHLGPDQPMVVDWFVEPDVHAE